jgi:hypothetical protein
MRPSREVILSLLLTAALTWMVSCSRLQNFTREEPAAPSVPPGVSQEMLNSLLRQNSRKELSASQEKLWSHKVRHRNETFFSIAQWYTGSGNNWPRLVKDNPNIDPKRIHIGDTVLIPEDLLKTRRPIPAGFWRPKRKHRKINKPRLPSTQPAAKKEAVTIYGPIEPDQQPGKPEKDELPVPLETIDNGLP